MSDTLFDADAYDDDLVEYRIAPIGEHPRTRTSDPRPSRLAAAEVARGAKDLEDAIVRAVASYGPMSAFDVARIIGDTRWDEGSVRTAVSRLKDARRIFVCDEQGVSPRGRACRRYSVRVERIETSVL